MGSHVISLRSAWRLGGALLIVIAITTLATALLLDVDTGPGIVALTVVATIAGLLCLRIPWERLDARWLLAVMAAGACVGRSRSRRRGARGAVEVSR